MGHIIITIALSAVGTVIGIGMLIAIAAIIEIIRGPWQRSSSLRRGSAHPLFTPVQRSKVRRREASKTVCE